jgi:hypothetical protein
MLHYTFSKKEININNFRWTPTLVKDFAHFFYCSLTEPLMSTSNHNRDKTSLMNIFIKERTTKPLTHLFAGNESLFFEKQLNQSNEYHIVSYNDSLIIEAVLRVKDNEIFIIGDTITVHGNTIIISNFFLGKNEEMFINSINGKYSLNWIKIYSPELTT